MIEKLYCKYCKKEHDGSFHQDYCCQECMDKLHLKNITKIKEENMIICPHCCVLIDGEPYINNINKNQQEIEIQCDVCGKKFLVTWKLGYVFNSFLTQEQIEKRYQIHIEKK